MTDQVETAEVEGTEEESYTSKVINASAPKKLNSDRVVSIVYDFGADLDGAVSKFGADVVMSNFVSKATITAQAAIRRFIEAGLSDEEIQEKMSAWQPGVALDRTVDPVAALMGKFGNMSAEEQGELLAKLQARATS